MGQNRRGAGEGGGGVRVRQRDGGREGSGETRERLKEKMTLRLNYFWNAPSLKV